MFWLKLDGFEDAVKEAWRCEDSLVDSYKRLDALLKNTARHLQSWAQRKVGNVKLQITVDRQSYSAKPQPMSLFWG
jgi:hypothetical protein